MRALSLVSTIFLTANLTASLVACGGGGDGAAPEQTVPFFENPFDGDFPTTSIFDHDAPFQFVDTNGYAIDFNGTMRNIGTSGAATDGHDGYDWRLPTNTPLKAVAAGRVVHAGDSVAAPCPVFAGSPIISAKVVIISHTAPNGDLYLSEYVHLASIAVNTGATISAGQILGISGNTGCSNGPHLHFQVYRWVAARDVGKQWVTVDPYGWTAAIPDPWSQHPDGTTSTLLWKEGQAPTLDLQ